MKVVFTSICSVLQPGVFDRRFEHNLDRVKEQKACENPEFATIDKYDIGAFLFDWEPPAVKRMKRLCDRGGAVIVLSSALREWYTLSQMKALFSTHQLDPYLLDLAPVFKGKKRYENLGSTTAHEIKEYLDTHTEVERFVVISAADWGYRKVFPNQYVETCGAFAEKDYRRALRILRYGSAKPLPERYRPDPSLARYW